MSNNNSLSLSWVMPIFDKQLNSFRQQWTSYLNNGMLDFAPDLTAEYHELYGAIIMATLSQFEELSFALIELSKHIYQSSQDEATRNTPEFEYLVQTIKTSTEILQSELKNYQSIGGFHHQLLSRSIHDIKNILPQSLQPKIQNKKEAVTDDEKSTTIGSLIEVICDETHFLELSDAQKNKLIQAWKFHASQLIADNNNQSQSIAQLLKVSQFMWRGCVENALLQKVWYLTNIWLDCLPKNNTPRPAQYLSLMSELDNALGLTFQKVDNENTPADCVYYNSIIADLLIQLKLLNNTSTEVDNLLQRLESNDDEFFLKILADLENTIFVIEQPAKVLPKLVEVQQQLAKKGWSNYASQLEVIINEVTFGVESAAVYEQTKWQVERLLQELYGDILTTKNTIDEKIGEGIDSTTSSSDVASTDQQDAGEQNIVLDESQKQQKLRQVRTNIESIKQSFNQYVHTNDIAKLPNKDMFDEILLNFSEMNLIEIKTVISGLSALIERLRDLALDKVSWIVAGSIADSISEFELFLDYLANKVFDSQILQQTLSRIDEANIQLDNLLDVPKTDVDTEVVDTELHKPDESVTRYHDSGAIVPNTAPEIDEISEVTDNQVIDNEVTDSMDSELLNLDTAENDVQNFEYAELGSDLETLVDSKTEQQASLAIAEQDKDDFKTLEADNNQQQDNQVVSLPEEALFIEDSSEIDRQETIEQLEVESANENINNQQIVNSQISEATIAEPVVASVSEELQAARDALPADDFDMDEDIREIFIEEAGEVLEDMEISLPAWSHDPENLEQLNEIRRGFHTLKGSGRMVGANSVGELSWAVENMLNRVLDNTLEVTPELVGFINETKEQIPTLVADYEAEKTASIDPAITIVKANNLLAKRDINSGLTTAAVSETEVVHSDKTKQPDEASAQQLDIDDTATKDSPAIIEEQKTIAGTEDQQAASNITDGDAVIVEESLQESKEEEQQQEKSDGVINNLVGGLALVGASAAAATQSVFNSKESEEEKDLSTALEKTNAINESPIIEEQINQTEDLMFEQFDDDLVADDEDIMIGDDEEFIIGDDEDIMIGDDEDIMIGDDEDIMIGGDEDIMIGDDEDIMIGGDEDIMIGGDEDVMIGCDEDVMTGDDEDIMIGGDEDIMIGGDEDIMIGGDEDIMIGGDEDIMIGDDEDIVIGDDEDIMIGGDEDVMTGDDEDIVIGGDEDIVIGGDEDIMIGDDEDVMIGDDEDVMIGCDEDVMIGGDEDIMIGGDEDIMIGGDEEFMIGGDEDIMIGGDEDIMIGGDEDIMIGGDEDIMIGGDEDIMIGDDEEFMIGDDEDIMIGGDEDIMIGGDEDIMIGGDEDIMIGGDEDIMIGDDDDIDSPATEQIKLDEDTVFEFEEIQKPESTTTDDSMFAGFDDVADFEDSEEPADQAQTSDTLFDELEADTFGQQEIETTEEFVFEEFVFDENEASLDEDNVESAVISEVLVDEVNEEIIGEDVSLDELHVEEVNVEENEAEITIAESSADESVSAVLQEARDALPADEFDMDEDIREIFIEEAGEVLEAMETSLPAWSHDPENLEQLKEIRRGFHTLKGSGRMVGAHNVGEMSWAVENMLNRVLDNSLEVTPELVTFINETKEQIPTLVNDYKEERKASIDPAITIVKANNLLAKRDINTGLPSVTNDTITDEPYEHAEYVDSDEFASKDVAFDDATNKQEELIEQDGLSDTDIQSQSDAQLEEEIAFFEDSEAQADDTAYDSGDSLLAAAGMAGVAVTGALAASSSTDKTVNKSSNHDEQDHKQDTDVEEQLIADDETINSSANSAVDSDKNDSDLLQELPSILLPFFEEAQAMPEDNLTVDEDIKEIFIEEAQEVLEEITPAFNKWSQDTDNLSLLTDVRRGFHTLKGSGRMVGANYSGDLAWSIEEMLNRVLDNSVAVSSGMLDLIADVLSAYPQIVDEFEKGSQQYPNTMPFWRAVANAYAKNLGDEFDYQSLVASYQDKQGDGLKIDNKQENSASVESAEEDSSQKILASIQNVNQELSESPKAKEVSEAEQEFIDIFVVEARERLEIIEEFVEASQDKDIVYVDDNVVRAFHTLRGASGSERLLAISNVSASIENSLVQLQNQDAPMTEHHILAISQSTNLIASYLDAFCKDDAPQVSSDVIEEDVESIKQLLKKPPVDDDIDDACDISIKNLMNDDIELLLDADYELEDKLTAADETKVTEYNDSILEQVVLLKHKSIKSVKFQKVLTALENAHKSIKQDATVIHGTGFLPSLVMVHEQLTDLFDALAASLSLSIDNEIISQLEELTVSDASEAIIIEQSIDNTIDADSRNVDETANSDERISDKPSPVVSKVDASLAAEIKENSKAAAAPAANSTKTVDVEFENVNTEPELLDIFLEEARELEEDITRSFSAWKDNPTDMEALKELQRYLHTIKGGARMSGISSVGDLTHEIETIYEKFVNDDMQPSQPWLNIMQSAQDVLSMQIDMVEKHKKSFFTKEIIEELLSYASLGELDDDVELTLPNLDDNQKTEEVVEEPEVEENDQLEGSEVEDERYHEMARNYNEMVEKSWEYGRPDADILEVFLEEVDELVESTLKNLQAFANNTGNVSNLQELQRELHTIKGGARMVNASGIAELAHEMETIYEDMGSRRLPATRNSVQLLTKCHDWLANAAYLLKFEVNPPSPKEYIQALRGFHNNPDNLKEVPNSSLQEYINAIDQFEAYKREIKGEHDISEMPPAIGNFGAFEEKADVSNEMIRVSSGLMEEMINLSGESAINRARVDMGITSLTHSIEEMGITVQRLADQLRRMDIELEAQIMAQIQDADLKESEGFDPLEMDQYSSLNQLSKSLSESASDLLDIKTTMLEKTRDSENLLLQLSRTQAELQDGLMNSRMVPFSRLTPRLQRIVRQTANEVNKHVELSFINANDEMDRTVLERVTSPLEHMLRNAVDHGIESPEERERDGKLSSGHVSLELLREGNELLIKLTDDGGGIDVDAVRKKAIKQGLIDPNDDTLTDNDIMQYIFNAGLSTTNKVTQISGRGVGMDVVRSEIRQLGGTVAVESVKGEGSVFTIRVPLTVAMSDALIVRIADRQFAIPLVQIERVEQISSEKLYEYYQSDKHTFKIADTDYRLRYLNEILTGNQINDLIMSTNTSLPVILVKNTTGQHLALQVDEIVSSRIELVVKPLTKQLSHVSGISSATIMGDGSVLMILDLLAIIRDAPVRRVTSMKVTMANATRKILVVDDSVTVRKVTSRFLEREGFETHVARDGLDAIEILQELTPDLILLDIEMPRMDGFEVATQVRFNSRLKNIPIIMITSRTGDKHRERAMEIGVNDYLGKPFQENILLERINKQLGKVGYNFISDNR